MELHRFNGDDDGTALLIEVDGERTTVGIEGNGATMWFTALTATQRETVALIFAQASGWVRREQQ